MMNKNDDNEGDDVEDYYEMNKWKTEASNHHDCLLTLWSWS